MSKPANLTPATPRLSQTLKHLQHPQVCQSCAVPWGNGIKITLWQECDHNDRPERIIVPLCQRCSAQLIKPHPRLYRALEQHEVFPGVMTICLDCKWRKDTRCECPAAQFNGGPGLNYVYPTPGFAFIDGVDQQTGRRYGKRVTLWGGPCQLCSGRDTFTTA